MPGAANKRCGGCSRGGFGGGASQAGGGYLSTRDTATDRIQVTENNVFCIMMLMKRQGVNKAPQADTPWQYLFPVLQGPGMAGSSTHFSDNLQTNGRRSPILWFCRTALLNP